MDLNEKEFNALITLLEDTDNDVYKHVFEKLSSYGESIIPSLETAWEKAFDPNIQQKIENLIHQIQFLSLVDEVKNWSIHESASLLKGAGLIAKYQYPDLDIEILHRQLKTIRKEIWIELNENLTPLEEVNVFNHIFYVINKFTENTNINDPQNSFINIVMDAKRGNSLSLGIVYLIIAHQLDLPVYGVNLPQHFILAYSKFFVHQVDSIEDFKKHVHFYVNPLNKGMIISQNEIKLFLKKMELEPKDVFFIPCTNQTIIRELIKQLISAYDELGYSDKIDELKILLEAVKD